MQNTDKEEELIEAAESKAITLNYMEDLDINTVVDTVCDMLVEFAKSEEVKQYYLPNIKTDIKQKWKYCPECGCDEIVNENLVNDGFRNCKRCFQEWWIDIDYTDTIKEVLNNFYNNKPQQDKSNSIEFHNWVMNTMYQTLNSKNKIVYVEKELYNKEVIHINGTKNRHEIADSDGVTIEHMYQEFLKRKNN